MVYFEPGGLMRMMYYYYYSVSDTGILGKMIQELNTFVIDPRVQNKTRCFSRISRDKRNRPLQQVVSILTIIFICKTLIALALLAIQYSRENMFSLRLFSSK